MKAEMEHKLKALGVLPVVVLEDAGDAKALAAALTEGGLPCAEMTFRTAAAEESIRIMTENYPDMLVGAGTVLTKEQTDRAVNAGNLKEYLSCPSIVACGGSWMVKSNLIQAGEFDKIREMTKEAVSLVKAIREELC